MLFTTAFLLFVCLFRLSLNWLHNRDCGKGEHTAPRETLWQGGMSKKVHWKVIKLAGTPKRKFCGQGNLKLKLCRKSRIVFPEALRCVSHVSCPQDVDSHTEQAERGTCSSGSPVQNSPQRRPHRSAATVSFTRAKTNYSLFFGDQFTQSKQEWPAQIWDVQLRIQMMCSITVCVCVCVGRTLLWSHLMLAGYMGTPTSTRWRETYTSPWESKKHLIEKLISKLKQIWG